MALSALLRFASYKCVVLPPQAKQYIPGQPASLPGYEIT